MRITLLTAALLLATTVADSQSRHWTETSTETIWRGRYKNCDHGYLISLPAGVVGHGTHSPNPNHGILISVDNPRITTEVTYDEPRLIDVNDINAGEDLGSARANLERYLKDFRTSNNIAILEQRYTRFQGFSAAYVHFRKTSGRSTLEVEELLVYRAPKGISPLFNIVLLQTTPEYYNRDHVLFLQIRDGLQFIPVPRGECSND
jgi:hypothetical protein